ncbi:uncharacterized protein LOC142351536 [Convolutriloba macropyga]|uniref:uncharacterized protein LOC142351536 n=1 Tax=Convolutriloba macropyga TaxID=536237 RepID=UPI003F524298
MEFQFQLETAIATDINTMTTMLLIISSRFNWKCTGFELPWMDGQIWPYLPRFLIQLASFSVFSKKVKFLRLNNSSNRHGHWESNSIQEKCEILEIMSPILSPDVVIETRMGICEFSPDLFIWAARVVKLYVDDDLLWDIAPETKVIRQFYLSFPSVVEINLPSLSFLTPELACCRNLRSICLKKISRHHYFRPESLEGALFDKVKTLKLGTLRYHVERFDDYLINFNLKFISKTFTNLTSLSIGCIISQDYEGFQFDLPASCVTVDIPLVLLKFAVKSRYVKDLMVAMDSRQDFSTMPLTKTVIQKFECQLETFVLICNQIQNVSYDDYANEILLPLLALQTKLKMLSIYFNKEGDLFRFTS